MSTSLTQQKNQGTAAGVLMIVSGALTALSSAGIVLAFGWFCVGLLWIVPLMVGVGEVVVGATILNGRPTSRVRALSAAGIVSALACGNLLGVLFEVIAQVLLSRSQEPAGYLEADWR